MIIVDTALKKRAAEGRPVKVALVGAGFMARGVANQIVNSVPGMKLVAISNRTLPTAALGAPIPCHPACHPSVRGHVDAGTLGS